MPISRMPGVGDFGSSFSNVLFGYEHTSLNVITEQAKTSTRPVGGRAAISCRMAWDGSLSMPLTL